MLLSYDDFWLYSWCWSGHWYGNSDRTCCWRRWWPRWWLKWHYGVSLWNHVQHNLWWNACLRFLLLHDRIIESLLHSFMSYLVLLHYYAELLCVGLHQIHRLIVHVDIGHLCCVVVCVVVCFEVPTIDGVRNVPRFCSKVLNEIPLLQGSVPHQAS